MTARVVIVDDEPLARRRAREVVASMQGFEVAAECRNGLEAVAAVRAGGCDVLLLDVRMPGLDGFGVLERLGPEHTPPVVFVTAYDDYAVRAFEVCALDYVEKPWQRERLAEALRRAAREHELRSAGVDGRLELLIGQRSEPPAPARRLALRAGGRVVLLDVEEVDWIESAGNYARVHSGGTEALTRETLTSLAARLPVQAFCRIHRRAIVALDRVRELGHADDGTAFVVLCDGTRLRCGRSHLAALRARL